jgi:muramoyltetrapeptide carboxypeptidase
MSTSRQPVKPVKPPALHRGDKVGIVAPASNFNRTDFEAGCEALRRAGYEPFYLDSIFERDVYFAGSAERRVRELDEMFGRADIKAILCARGGYGSNYLLGRLNLEKIRARPRIFVGYSDLTSLLTYFSDAAGLVTFHGPMVAKDWAHTGGVDLMSWKAALSGCAGFEVPLDSEVKAFVDGEAEGKLYGGCLSMLVASLGTPYEIKTAGTILFLEDVAAKPFQVDRMLMQLKLGGYFEGVRGIVFGQMLDCVQSSNQDYTLEEVVRRIVGDLGIPVAYGVRSGHVSSRNITLPFGVKAALSVRAGSVALRVMEPAVTC